MSIAVVHYNFLGPALWFSSSISNFEIFQFWNEALSYILSVPFSLSLYLPTFITSLSFEFNIIIFQVHDEREMDRVLGIEGIDLIGINNRNLGKCGNWRVTIDYLQYTHKKTSFNVRFGNILNVEFS